MEQHILNHVANGVLEPIVEDAVSRCAGAREQRTETAMTFVKESPVRGWRNANDTTRAYSELGHSSQQSSERGLRPLLNWMTEYETLWRTVTDVLYCDRIRRNYSDNA